ncbi:MAG: TonB-dependent receptor [Roseateles depolymerans]|uniref:TonB-dependent receptor n=1 Tax=Roseateles depolymerans TaxID=76731 RepID=A0A2W5F853_9BURK|nr:MAG: TonB-dependent receptor [Roseateles depolymerans]
MKRSLRPALAAPGTPIQWAVMALLAGSVPAWAQTAPAKPADNKLPEVVVTATKKTTSLQKTPVAVTALSAETLEDAHMSTILDIVHLVPGLQATAQGDHGVTTMTLRGIGNDTAKTEYADPEVALFVNGIYTARPEGAAALMFDMAGVEVLRGPQGTLWGRNSTVGAVNFKTAPADLKNQSGNAEVGMGNYGRLGMRGHFNLPLAKDMAVRFAFAHEQHDGYVDYQNPVRYTVAQQQAAWLAASSSNTLAQWKPINYNLFVQGGQKYSAQDQTGARVSFAWQPTPELRWDISYERFQDRGTPSMALVQRPREGQKFWSALIDTAPYLHRDSDVIRSRVDYDLSPGLRLSYVAGVSKFSGSGTFDQDMGQGGSPTSFATGGAGFQEDRTNWSKYRSHSHEVQLQSTGKQELDWILGLYYGAENNGIRFDIPIFNGTQEGTVGWQGSFIQPKETVDTKAVFGQATWNLTDALHLTGGVRYTRDVRENINGRGHGWAYDPAYPAVPVDPGCDTSGVNLKGGCGFGEGDVNDGRYSGSKATWLARVSYDLSKTDMVYASVATGYKSGGLQDRGATYKPENLTSYEAGYKTTLLDGAMTFNTAVYHLNFRDFQFGAPAIDPSGARFFGFSNAKGAKVSGLEFEVAVNPTANDRVHLSGAFTKSKLGELIGFSNDYTLPPCSDPRAYNKPGDPTSGYISANCLDVTGNKMPHAPTFSATLLWEHSFHLANEATLAPRIALHYETKSYLSVFNLAEGNARFNPAQYGGVSDGDMQKSYARLDIGARYTAKNWYADLFVRNVSDGKVKTSAGGGANGVFTAQYKPPRTIGLNVGTDF